MASPTQWTWVWVNAGSWWWTGRPGVLRFMVSKSRTRLSDWSELNWTEGKMILNCLLTINHSPICQTVNMERPAFKGILEATLLIWGLIQLPIIGLSNRMLQSGILHLTTGPGTQSLTFSVATSAMSPHTSGLVHKAPWWPGLWCLPHHDYRPRLCSGRITFSLPFGKRGTKERSSPISLLSPSGLE